MVTMQDQKYVFLDQVNSPEDIKEFDRESTEVLAGEIRNFLINNVSECGGHLASNLGVVELTLALHKVFNTPEDKIVWDVGHQSYVHKILTGRKGDFSTLRTPGGLSGFTKRSESEYDPFGAGHSSTSVSAALGIAEAEKLKGGDAYTVAVVGDGAFTGGMIYEALNNCDRTDGLKLVIVLNENEMSISKNIGSVAKTLSKLRTNPGYFKTKEATRSFLAKIPFIGKGLVSFIIKCKKAIKNILYGSNYFENLGLYYIGPIDGHDIGELEDMLNEAKKCNQCVLIHVKTQKGRGYAPAEERPDKYHSVAPKDAEPAGGFSKAFGKAMIQSAESDKRICAITAAMGRGTGLSDFEKEFPDRFFDVGIAEEHAVSMAGGLAKQGMIPVVALYSTFLQRTYDMILQDICMLGLHVVFAVDRAGLVGEDGESHHGIYDVGFLRHAPGLKVLTPASRAELDQMLHWAVEEQSGPVAIRYPRGGDRGYADSAWNGDAFCVVTHREGEDVTLLTYGVLINNAMNAAELLAEVGVNASVQRLMCVSDLPIEEIANKLPENGKLFIVEEVSGNCGICQEIAYELQKLRPDCTVFGKDLGKQYICHGNLTTLYEHYGLSPEAIKSWILEEHSGEN